MLLNIKIHDAIDEDASKIISAITKTLVDIRKGYKGNPSSMGPYMDYSFERENPTSQLVSQSGSCMNATFANYMNSTKKE